MKVDPGELNKKIEITTYYVRNEEGFPQKELKMIRKCWAKVTEESGTEKLKSGMELGERKARFLIRSSDESLTRDMKIRYRGELFDMEYIRRYDGGYTEIVGVRRD